MGKGGGAGGGGTELHFNSFCKVNILHSVFLPMLALNNSEIISPVSLPMLMKILFISSLADMSNNIVNLTIARHRHLKTILF